MGHIVFGAPGLDRYPLHERLRRSLQQRDHRLTVLPLDAASATFWQQQLGDEAPRLATAPPTADQLELIEQLAPALTARRRHGLASHCRALREWFASQRPDLLLLHQQRGAEATLLQYVAREHGCRVLWTGCGLLPHTMQLDERGLDGDAAASRRAALDYRVVRGEPSLLQACLAQVLARTQPVALGPGQPSPPPWQRRLHDLPAMWRSHGAVAALRSLSAWRHALPPRPRSGPAATAWLPPSPFVAVLLQGADDPRVVHDSGSPPHPATLVQAAMTAAHAVDPELRTVTIAIDDHSRRPRWLPAGVVWLPAAAAADAVAVAAATFTINHPLASVALLAGTPVVHSGRALFGLRGVSVQAAPADWPGALASALHRDHPTLRERFLTWVFGYGHVWCSSTHPDHNGLLGLVQAIEQRLGGPPTGAPLRYRNGPGWPLAADGRRH